MYKTLKTINLDFKSTIAFDKLMEEAIANDAENQIIFKEYEAAYKAFYVLAEKIETKMERSFKGRSRYPKMVNTDRWNNILGAKPYAPEQQVLVVKRWQEEFERKKKADQEKMKREENERSKKAEQELLVVKAIDFLRQRGYTIENLKCSGPDIETFDIKNQDQIVDFANEVAYEEKIKEMKADATPISFGGDDECRECSGWDMESHRCECGNRRVSWEKYGDFTNMTVYAQAY